MPFIKISGLTTATAVSATNQFEINQNSTSRSATVAQVAAFARGTATDTVVLPAGTVSAPGLTFTGDTNTGIYSPAADTIAFTEGGVEAMRIDSAGNVGIGLVPNSGQGTLQSFRSIAGGAPVTSGTSDPNQAAMFAAGAVQLSYGALASGTGWLQMRASANFATNYDLLLQPNGGNVGIGTSSPFARLHVVGTIQAVNGSSAAQIYSDGGAAYFASSGAFPSLFLTNSAERMRIDASGNVGIGTSSPAWRLTAVGGSTQISPGTSAQEGIRFTRSTGVCTINGINNDNNAYNALSFATGAAEAMRITTGGEVYIAGTTDQGAYNLQVNGTGVWGAGAYVNGSDARIKDDIAPLASGLDVVAKLKPVQFRYKESWSKDTSLQPGFIAQELQAALADQPYVDGVVLQGPEYMSVAYQSLIPLLTKAIQELKADNDALKARVAALENK